MADYHSDRTNHLSPYPAHSDMSHDDDYKASYDDLIDEGTAPYAPNNGHQTVALDAMTPTVQRQPSRHLLSQQPSYSTNSASIDREAGSKRVDWGYPPLSTSKQDEKQSFWQKWIPDSVPCRLFVAVVLLETIVDLLLEGELLLQFQKLPKPDTDTGIVTVTDKMPTYLSIFVFAHVFQFVMALDAVYARNTLQFMFLIAFNALFLVYAVIQIDEVSRAKLDTRAQVFSSLPLTVTTLTKIIPAVIGVAEAAFIALGWKIYNEFGWKVYKYIGADRRMKKMYTQYQVYQCLVKFDVFFFVGFCVQFIGLVLKRQGVTGWEYYLTCAALPLSILLLIEGHLAARHENKWMMATFMSGCIAAMVYFVYKLYRTLELRDKYYQNIWKTLAIFSVLDILLLIPTFVLALLVMSNFGRGLKEQLEKNVQMSHGRARSQGPAAGLPMSANPNRMSID